MNLHVINIQSGDDMLIFYHTCEAKSISRKSRITPKGFTVCTTFNRYTKTLDLDEEKLPLQTLNLGNKEEEISELEEEEESLFHNRRTHNR